MMGKSMRQTIDMIGVGRGLLVVKEGLEPACVPSHGQHRFRPMCYDMTSCLGRTTQELFAARHGMLHISY